MPSASSARGRGRTTSTIISCAGWRYTAAATGTPSECSCAREIRSRSRPTPCSTSARARCSKIPNLPRYTLAHASLRYFRFSPEMLRSYRVLVLFLLCYRPAYRILLRLRRFCSPSPKAVQHVATQQDVLTVAHSCADAVIEPVVWNALLSSASQPITDVHFWGNYSLVVDKQ